jgi:hypothetical protein
MGRAFRVVKRMAHLTVEVAERPTKAGAVSARARRTGQAAAAAAAEKAE